MSSFQFITSVPEKLGISSEAVLSFIEHLERRKCCMHSVLILRHGEIALEAYYPPFTIESLHRMYSTTKTFVSIAIGFMIDEGKITLQSRIADFFQKLLPANPYPAITKMTVRDLLLMATPFNDSTYTVNDKNWICTFFNAKPTHDGGAVFHYDTSGTVTLNALVEKISGQNLVDYLRPRLFDPLGISKNAWCIERPEGGAWGGSGLQLTTRDLARFAFFLINKGNWQGKQLISSSYIDEACTPQIDNRVATAETEFHFGYGYQIWCTRHNGFATVGMGSQLSVCVPDKDLILVTTGDTQNTAAGNDTVLDLFWTDIYDKLIDNTLTENKRAYSKLQDKLSRLEFPSIDGSPHSPLERELDGAIFLLEENPMAIKKISFNFSHDEGTMSYDKATGSYKFNFGLGRYTEGVFPETHYFGKRIGVASGCGYHCKAQASWFNNNSLTLFVYLIDDYFGSVKMNFYFKEERINIIMNKTAEWFLEEYQGFAMGQLE
jgi:CubicO group peptidase (beta-lactamase class C family)